ncbi:26S proteasome non-ATPase regulatory subunit 2 homolog A-like isoform X5 [Camellia sinensis]|uniref:26S proteasome non-ATPase regulatory subunit 2 homolog A-like isoform X5 n=1 Tax=Camellia sinensis TaxID=4442 RepID=UPI0010363BEE|nr:26S proteasome non-ATPase regulatory subunit 2 homolog A-like isoform X5 [Camellia sinensis]
MARDPNNAVIVPKKKNEMKDEDLSEEDLALKKQLELYVERIQDSDADLQEAALQSMRQEILTSTSSMTSVPKPLKFLRPHYGTLKAYYDTMADSDLKYLLADVLSVLAMTMSAEGERESLKYRLLGSEGDTVSWGHEYVRNLAGEIVEEYMKRQSEDLSVDDLMELVEQIVAFLMEHNAEFEAVDLLMQVEDLYLVLELVDSTNYKRTCLYLISAARRYIPDPDDLPVLLVFAIYLKFEEYPSALQIALFLDNLQYVHQIFTACDDLLLKKQFCYILGQHRITFVLDEEMSGDDECREILQGITNNGKLSEGYLMLARDIEVMEPKSPEDIYKAHLLHGRASAGASVNSASQNLAATFVNAFVNAGFGQDKLMTVPSEASSGGSSGNWVFKNKAHGKASAAASLIRSKLSCVLEDKKMPLDVIVFTAISLGLVYVGSCDEDVSQTIISALKHRSVSELGQPLTRLLPLGLGLLYLGKQEGVEATAEISKTLNTKIRKHCYMTLFSCAYAGTGDVLKVQYLLGQCAQHLKRGETHQGPAVLGIAMVAMAEELGLEMAIRSLEHLLRYGEQNIRKAVPLALGLLCISNPKVNVMDTLSRISHDTDIEVAMAAVISLGLIGSGTNNARIAGMLHNLSSYYYKEPRLLFCVRIAQGLVHLGKGLLTLAPYHFEHFLLSS